MSQLLNLDQLLPEEKYVVFKGVNHILATNSVESWLKLMAYRQQILSVSETRTEDGAEAEAMASEMVDLQVKIAAIACPTIPESDLRQLPMTVLMKLVEAIGQEMSGGAGGETEAAGEVEAEEAAVM